MAESPELVPLEDGNRFLEDELEALRSIYINETNVYEENEATVVSIDIHPATADNLQEQYVKLTLNLSVRDGYPEVIPEIKIRNPRGLSDEKLTSITNNLIKKAEDKRGSSMLFEIIEAAKDYLTAGNRPCEECAICLYGFHDKDIFTKTECYHYFHSHCLARYAKNSSLSDDDSKSDDSSKNELLCPVCRLPIHFDEIDDAYPSPVKCEDEFSVTDTMLQTQKKLQELYIKQVEKGGIIDLEAEKNKYLIEISHVPSILDVASESKSEEETSVKLSEEKDKTQKSSPSEKTKTGKLDPQKSSSNRSFNSEGSEQKVTKHSEDRKRNDFSHPYQGNDYKHERFQNNRGRGGYRRDPRGGRHNYDRRYDSYNNERGDRYVDGINRNRYTNPRKNNWQENQFKSNRYEHRNSQNYDDRRGQNYERRDKYQDRNNQRYERHNKYDDESSQKYERHAKYDDGKGQKDERQDKYDDRKSQKDERHDKYDDRKSQKDERHDKYDEGNSQKDERHKFVDSGSQEYDRDNSRSFRKKQRDHEEDFSCKYDDDRSHNIDRKGENDCNYVQEGHTDNICEDRRSMRYNSHRRNFRQGGVQSYNQHSGRRERYDRDNLRSSSKKQHDLEEVFSSKYDDDRSHNLDQKGENECNDVQEGHTDNICEDRRNTRHNSNRRNFSQGGVQSNNQYSDRRERYDKRDGRNDNNKMYGRFEGNRNNQYDRRNNRFEGSRNGQYDKKDGRFDRRKYNEYNGSRRNENFHSTRADRANEERQNRFLNPENEVRESDDEKSNRTLRKESGNLSITHLAPDEENVNESEYHIKTNECCEVLSKDELVSEGAENVSDSLRDAKSNYSSDYRHNFPNRNSGPRRQNESRSYGKHYQRSNSNGDRFDARYSKQSNYQPEEKQAKPQNFRGNPVTLDEGENLDALKCNEAVSENTGVLNESSLEEDQVYNNDESGEFSDKQHSKKISARTNSENGNHYKSYRDSRQGYNNRFQNNKNYHETRPYRNNAHSRNNQSDSSDRTSNDSKRCIPPKHASDISQTEIDSEVKPEPISKESVVESVPVDTSSKKPTQVPPKSSDLEKSVPTSNFLPPMSSVVPPPGFTNPTRKIVYGLAAANPPPGFNRS